MPQGLRDVKPHGHAGCISPLRCNRALLAAPANTLPCHILLESSTLNRSRQPQHGCGLRPRYRCLLPPEAVLANRVSGGRDHAKLLHEAEHVQPPSARWHGRS